MRKGLKRVIGAVLLLGVLGAVAVAVLLQMADRKQQRRIEVRVAPLAAAAGAVSVERGRYLYDSRGCAHCHGADGAGKTFVEDGALVLAGPQVAPGKASTTAAYRPEDWVRTLRHGVKPDGRPAMIMPSEDFNRLTDADLGSIVAYVQQLPAVDGQPARIELPLPVRVLYALDRIEDAAQKIDHTLPPQQPVAEGLSVEHGRYVAQMCIGCHGPGLAGGRIPGGPPHWPAAANLTPGADSAMPRYADAAAFTAMLRSGKRPDGTPIGVMPFDSLRALSDVDSGALYRYLKTLPARPAGTH